MLNYFHEIFGAHKLGDEWYGQLFKILGVIGSIIAFLYKGLPFIVSHISDYFDKKSLNKDLNPYYSPADVEQAIRYYIPTKFQNVSPSIDDEPGRNYIASAKQKLIPLFLDNIFRNNTESNKFYLILADSGMGKTTFMINLYISYKNKIHWPWSPIKYEILLLPLGANDILDKLKNIPDETKKQTILLLDAFDEDVKALLDYEKRMNEILDVAWKYRTVVISCRTQFFPSEFEEPEKTKYMTFGGTGQFSFQKLYLSAFDDHDISQYLSNKYSFFDSPKKAKALEIIKKCPNLMVRPMLLSHIGVLVDSPKTFVYVNELYEILIDEWITRESRKPGIIEKYGTTKSYKKLLYGFSQGLAWNLYENRNKRGGFYISNSEEFIASTGLSITEYDEIEQMSEREKRGKSLLNRDANGNYKFSHKSIFEYFLAITLYPDSKLFYDFDFSGMTMTKLFLRELFYCEIERMYKPVPYEISDGDLVAAGIGEGIGAPLIFKDRVRADFEGFQHSIAIDFYLQTHRFSIYRLYYFSLFETLHLLNCRDANGAILLIENLLHYLLRNRPQYTHMISQLYNYGYNKTIIYLYRFRQIIDENANKSDGSIIYAIFKSQLYADESQRGLLPGFTKNKTKEQIFLEVVNPIPFNESWTKLVSGSASSQFMLMEMADIEQYLTVKYNLSQIGPHLLMCP